MRYAVEGAPPIFTLRCSLHFHEAAFARFECMGPDSKTHLMSVSVTNLNVYSQQKCLLTVFISSSQKYPGDAAAD